MNYSKKEQLQKVLNDFNIRDVQRIEIHWTDGQKSGIGNDKAIETAMTALRAELERQISGTGEKEDTITITLTKREVAQMIFGFMQTPEPNLENMKDCPTKELYKEFLTLKEEYTKGNITVSYEPNEE